MQRLIRALQSLLEGESAIDELVACVPRAIPALREFLLLGRIGSVPQPRMWAVEALARYLRASFHCHGLSVDGGLSRTERHTLSILVSPEEPQLDRLE
jgi:hypothetical protein